MWCFVQFSLYKIIKRKAIDNYGGKKEFFSQHLNTITNYVHNDRE